MCMDRNQHGTSLESLLQTHPEFCVPRDSESCQVDKDDEHQLIKPSLCPLAHGTSPFYPTLLVKVLNVKRLPKKRLRTHQQPSKCLLCLSFISRGTDRGMRLPMLSCSPQARRGIHAAASLPTAFSSTESVGLQRCLRDAVMDLTIFF